MNQVLHPPLPLASDHPFSSEQECIEHIGGSHAHHSSFAAAGVPEQLRREGALAHSTHIPLSSIASRSYGAPRPDTAYHTGSDSGTGSISTSPSSNASLASYSYSFTNQYPLTTGSYFNSAAGAYSMSAPRRTSTFTDASSSAMLPPARSPGLGNPVSPSMGLTSRDNYTTGTPGLHRHSHNLSPRYSDIRYSSQSDTPRSVLPTAMPVSYQTGYPTSTYTTHTSSQETPPFNAQETYGSITCDGSTVVPNIDAKIEKGFFMSPDSVWTCYRRNYFAVNVSYGLSPWTPNLRLYYDAGNGKQPEQIQSMAVSLAAVVDGAGGKTIELIQHTPKRDKGPQLPMKKELLAPTPPGKSHDHGAYSVNNYHQSSTQPGPQLPLQHDGDTSQQYSPTTHTNSNYQHAFERIQFKSATANNGKRRAQQQYYHLIVELWANVQSPREQEPRWVKVAARSSQPVVVRGRSPSHYQNEMPHNGTRGPGSSGYGGSGQNGLGGRGNTSYSTYANGLSGSGSAMMGGNTYRGTTYSLDPSPIGSHSVSTASSMSGGPVEGLVGDHHMMDGEDAKMLDANPDYQYYPAGMYDGMSQKAEVTLPLPERRSVKEEYPGPAALATGWQIGGCGRYTGLETSRGSYPQDVHLY